LARGGGVVLGIFAVEEWVEGRVEVVMWLLFVEAVLLVVVPFASPGGGQDAGGVGGYDA